MTEEHESLLRLRRILARKLRATQDLLDAASVCRSLALSELEGAGSFLLLALYFEGLERSREGTAVDAEKYESGVSELLPLIHDCLDNIEVFDPVKLTASLDSFARTALRLRLP
jgi:hypothetical protein